MIEKHLQDIQQFLTLMSYRVELVNSQLLIYDANGEVIDYFKKIINNDRLFSIESENDIFSYTWRYNNEQNYIKEMTVHRNKQNITLIIERNHAIAYDIPIISLEIEDEKTEDLLSVNMCNSDFGWIEFEINKLEGNYQTNTNFELNEESNLHPLAKYVEELRNYSQQTLSYNGFELKKFNNKNDISILSTCIFKDINQRTINNYDFESPKSSYEGDNYQIDQSYDEVLNQFLSSPKINGFISFVNQQLVKTCPEMICLLEQNKQFEKIVKHNRKNNDEINEIIGNFVPSFQKVKTKSDN